MKTYQNLEILKNEVERVLMIVNRKVVTPFTVEKLMDNITIANAPMNDYWSIRISKVSAKDLSSWDNTKFTDGDNNGKSILIKRSYKEKELNL